MECRAKNAEKESELLREQMEDMKIQLVEVCCFYSAIVSFFRIFVSFAGLELYGDWYVSMLVS